ncbi:MAG TPA: ATP-binding protein [Gaiellaceae bacterium]
MSQTPQRAPVDGGTGGADRRQKPWRERSGLVRQLTLSAIAVAVGLAVLFAVLFYAIVSLRDRSLEAQRSQQVIAAASELQTLVVDMETGVRGFILTDDEKYLDPWRNALRRYPRARSTLLRLTEGNPAQHQRAVQITRRADQYSRNITPELVGFMRRNPPLAREYVRAGFENDQVPKIRDLFGKLLSSEKAVGAVRADRVRSTTRNALIAGEIGLGVALLVILLGALYINRAVARPVRMTAGAAARIAGGDLSGRLREDGPGEIGELERSFNTMAASLESTVADLEERNRKLYESEQVKSELVSSVSHELRTPLASVLGFSALMLERDLPPEETARYLEVIRAEARRLAALLNDLLDLQRVEAQTLELRLDEFDLNELLATQVTLYSAQSEAHQLRLDRVGEPIIVRGDRDRLAQVVGNLLSNAIKYSPGGGEVQIRAAQLGDEAWVWVQDLGLGIPAGHQDRIFTKFFRGDVGRERGISGTGLGLVLARQIVEAHGGEVGFESEESVGSTFWFWLPAAARIEVVPEVAPAELTAGDDAKARHRV